MFALATNEHPALFITVLGEPPLKMLRYQQQFSFFDQQKLDKAIRFVNLSDEVATGDFDQVLERIMEELNTSAPALVFIDSFRSVMLEARRQPAMTKSLQRFVQQLNMQLSSWQATTFLIGEYPSQVDNHPIFTVAGGLISLQQSVHRDSMVRKMQILKMRGQATSPGVHTFRTSRDGIEVYPSPVVRDDPGFASAASQSPRSDRRLSLGVPHLD